MKKTAKRIISVCLIAVMVLCAAPLSGFTGLFASAAEFEPSGNLSETVRYTFDEATGTLTISGTGDIPDYNDTSWSSFSPFYNNSEIKNVIIDEGITRVGSYLFKYNKNIESISLCGSIKSIGDHAFYFCTSLKEIVIPDEVQSIGNCAFLSCTSLKGIVIPDKVQSIGSCAFQNCASVETVDLGNVETIGSSAFNCCKNIKEIIMPDTLTVVGDFAFRSCSALEKVTFSSILEALGSGAFENCESLKAITIPDGIKSIGSATFEDCTGLETVDLGNVESIERYAFYGCTNLKEITMPDKVTAVGDYAFYNCSSLEKVTFSSILETVGEYAFYSCKSLKEIILPDSVSVLGKDAFRYCDNLEKVSLSGNLAEICDYTFYSCCALKEIVVPDSVKRIGEYAFDDCTGLEKIDLGSGVEVISDSAFYNCASLKEIVIPDSVVSLDSVKLFDNCTNLEKIHLGKNALFSRNAIINGIFKQCPKLKEITVDSQNMNYCVSDGALYTKDMSMLIAYPENNKTKTTFKIPDSVKEICNYAFYGCGYLEEITFGSGIETIGRSAFANCSGLKGIRIPDSITQIPADAFKNCTSLKEVTIGNSVKTIQLRAFSGCTSLEKIDCGSSIESVDNGVFDKCNNLKDITFSDTLTTLQISDSFTNLENVYYYGTAEQWKKVLFSTASDLRSAFATANIHFECMLIKGSLTDTIDWVYDKTSGHLVIRGTGAIPDYEESPFAEYGIFFLPEDDDEETIPATVSVESGITSIGRNTFKDGVTITEVMLKDGVKSVNSGAFSGCDNLRVVFTESSSFDDFSSFNGIGKNISFIVKDDTNAKANAESAGVNYSAYSIVSHYDENGKKTSRKALAFSGNTTVYEIVNYEYLSYLVSQNPNATYLYFDELVFNGVEIEEIFSSSSGLQIEPEDLGMTDTDEFFTIRNVYISVLRENGNIMSFKDILKSFRSGDLSGLMLSFKSGENKTVFEKIASFFKGVVENAFRAISKAVYYISKLFKR